MISICIGVFSLLIIGAITDLGTKILNKELDSMGVNGISITGDATKKPIGLEELKLISKISGVEKATPVLMQKTSINKGAVYSDSIGWGIGSGAEQIIAIEMMHGRVFNDYEINRCLPVCILDSDAAKALFGRTEVVGKNLSVNMNGTFQNYEIIGIAKAGSSLLSGVIGDYLPLIVYYPYSTIQAQTGINYYQQIAVNLEENRDSEEISDRIKRIISGKAGPSAIKCENLSQQREKLSGIFDLVKSVLALVGGISLIVAGIGNTTVMISGVRERTGEIGIKKSIGASSLDIVSEFLSESILLSVIGCIVGFLIYLAVSLAARLFGVGLFVSPNEIYFVAGITVFVGIVSGAYPAFKAARLRPVEAFNSI